MKTMNFRDYLSKWLNENEIIELEIQANIEAEAIKQLQEGVYHAVEHCRPDKRISKH